MALENEARFHLPETKFLKTVDRLVNTPKALAPFRLTPKGNKLHADTYFDANGALRKRGWSLRIRVSGSDVRATLKTPITNDQSVHGDTKEELENSDNSQLFSTLAEIIARLAATGVVNDNIDGVVSSHIMIKGAYPTLRELGLKDLFTVKTDRHRWIVSEGAEDLAELAVDESFYDVGMPGTASDIRECRIEVELLDADQNEALTRICNLLMSKFDITEVHDSKFERGMLHFDTRGLRDKLEVKLRLSKDSDYAVILDRIQHDPAFVRGHRFTRMPERTISDIYFDSPAQELFQAGHYLRLRREGKGKELVFRRLTQDEKYGHVLQEEVVAKGEGEAFRRNWQQIERWLSGTTGRAIAGDIPNLDAVGVFLNGAGFRPVLEVEIERLPWIVERVDESKPYAGAPDHVAKLKYDEITMRRADDRSRVRHSVEFEVTGVESDATIPGENNRLGYEAFVPAFEQACSYYATDKNIEHILSAKYFEGMLNLGIAERVPHWVEDNRLRFHVSLLRQELDERNTYDLVKLIQEEQGEVNGSDRAREIIESIIQTLSSYLRSEGQIDAPASLASFLDSRLRDGREATVQSVVNVTVSQNQAASSSASARSDMSTLADELLLIASQARRDGTVTGDQIAAIEAAQKSAKAGDEKGVINNLRKAASVAMSLAKEIGTPVATAFIEAKCGLR
jgi:adenylate cyclase class IV